MREAFPETSSWRITVAAMLAISALVFLFQRFVLVFIDPIFEFCIFHLPTLVAAIVYARLRKPSAV